MIYFFSSLFRYRLGIANKETKGKSPVVLEDSYLVPVPPRRAFLLRVRGELFSDATANKNGLALSI